MNLKIYGDSISGNCLKVKWTAEHMGMAYDWVEIRVLEGETRTLDIMARLAQAMDTMTDITSTS